MSCTHEAWEKDTAVEADGICPICLQSELAALRESNERLEGMANRLASQDAQKHREIIALRERVAALEWVVKKLEYIEEYPSEEELCPICRAEKPTHYEDCELHAALQESK